MVDRPAIERWMVQITSEIERTPNTYIAVATTLAAITEAIFIQIPEGRLKQLSRVDSGPG
jgi:hypothetical protein